MEYGDLIIGLTYGSIAQTFGTTGLLTIIGTGIIGIGEVGTTRIITVGIDHIVIIIIGTTVGIIGDGT